MVVNTIKKIMETYANLYIPKQKKEKFDDTSSSYGYITMIIMWFVSLFAIYLSFKCNNGFNWGHFLLAFFFAPFYIVYHLAVTRLCGLID
jgi:hypothetical protein